MTYAPAATQKKRYCSKMLFAYKKWSISH